MKKKNLSLLTKTKLVTQGEYLLISIVFMILGILKILNIMKTKEGKSHVFIIITCLGAIWVITDFIWATLSKKRREKVTYLDKIIMLPFGLWMLTYDSYSIIIWNNSLEWYKFGIGGSFIAVSILYGFQAIYHWFKPTKEVLNIVAEAELEEAAEQEKNEEKTKNS